MFFFSGILSTGHTPSTYCNPINIDYTYSIVNTSKGLSYRSGADPAVVKFRDEYYMFVTRSFGYWHSTDLRIVGIYSPSIVVLRILECACSLVIKDSILIAMGNPSEWQCVIFTDDPKKGTWQGVPSLIPEDVHDPALFVDDDNRVYLYVGSSNVYPIKGVELDPGKLFPSQRRF